MIIVLASDHTQLTETRCIIIMYVKQGFDRYIAAAVKAATTVDLDSCITTFNSRTCRNPQPHARH
jgi:hypothetical protein